jgi:hypothetical protein
MMWAGDCFSSINLDEQAAPIPFTQAEVNSIHAYQSRHNYPGVSSNLPTWGTTRSPIDDNGIISGTLCFSTS